MYIRQGMYIHARCMYLCKYVCIYLRMHVCVYIYVCTHTHMSTADSALKMLKILGIKIENTMGWFRLVGSSKSQVSFTEETYKKDDILQKSPIILRSLLIVATP